VSVLGENGAPAKEEMKMIRGRNSRREGEKDNFM
jgi:hypothetical protein